ncbi:MAG: hypothetical protein COX19_15335 [Desulfobacterales bacterium CG23_combo_of_CG06-09_8_20_14_all_51_8]|nr:MAG: hypothetical protein COX19_15335 [Desulfobacterales bacterium CG23_combo_of_CG06-09_8_20_14_all_51_8]
MNLNGRNSGQMNSNVVLKGSLAFLNLGELLQLLGMSGSSGILKLTSNHTEHSGFIYMMDGNPVDAEFQGTKGQDVLNTFFGWVDAEFEFSEEKILHRRTIQKSRMEIILDGLRMVDDGLTHKIGQASSKKSSVDIKDASGIPIIKGPLVDYLYIVDEDDFSDGQEIVVQSKFGNWLWVILEGTVAVVRQMPGGPVTINKLSEGAFIGGIGSLKEKTNIRNATVCAVGKVQLGVIDFHRIMEEFSKISQDLKQVLFSLDKRLAQVTTVCANVHFKKIKLHKTMEDMQAFSFSEHPEDKILKIVSGRAVIAKQINDHFIELCELAPEDVIGNIPFLGTSHEPHSAMVFVSDPFQVSSIDLIDLKEEYDELSQTFKNMIVHTSTSLSVTTGRLMDMIKKPVTQ